MKLQNPHLISYTSSKNAGNKYYKRFVMTFVIVIVMLTIISIIEH